MRFCLICLLWCVMLVGVAPGRSPAHAQLRGHGGPIRALAVSTDGTTALSGSFDASAIRWALRHDVAEQVLRLHDSAVNAVAILNDGRAVTAGADAIIGIWTPGKPVPDEILKGHEGPIVALAVSPDGATLASASWDRPVRLWPLVDGPSVALEGHQQNVNGPVALINRETRDVLRTLAGSGAPIWAVAFLPDGRTLLTGGGDRVIRRWDAETGEPLDPAERGPEDQLAAYAGGPGAQVFRACVACHTLAPDQGARAGPSLHGIFGRRIASLPGYNYSEAIKHLDIVWTPETLARLFEIGPARYTPGTKMPEQRIGSREDRDALVKFLERVTR